MEHFYTFELPFRLKSKKNSRPIFVNKKTGKHFLGKSKEFTQFEKDSAFILNAQKNKQGIKNPLSGDLKIISLKFEFKGAQRSDLDNMLTSILDLLQDCGVIENDKQFKLIQNIWVIPNAGRDHTSIQLGSMPDKKPGEITLAELVESLKPKR
jgi:Holliday junction resolvase RusA-like endonuclease